MSESRYPQETPEVPVETGALSGDVMATLLGELHTEARCVVVTAVPDRLTPVGTVLADLRSRGAYDRVPVRRFNVHNILETATPLVTQLAGIDSESGERVTWVQKRTPAPLGSFATACAGAMLDFSLSHGRPLRTILGEKRKPIKDHRSAIETRLAILAGIQAITRRQPTFTKYEMAEQLEPYDITPEVARNHLNRLAEHDMLEPVKTGRRIKTFRVPVQHDGYDAAALQIDAFLKLVSDFAVMNPLAIARGARRGAEIYGNRSVVAGLIERSYATSGHTGKSSKLADSPAEAR